MLARTIDQLTDADPVRIAHQKQAGGDPMQVRSAEAFRNMYGNLSVGWKFATRWANQRKPWTFPLLGKDRWVFRAYLMRRYGDRYYDKDIAQAFNLHNPPEGMECLRGTINAAILTFIDGTDHNHHLHMVAKALSLPFDVVSAYEALFFNVLDRRIDSQCVAMTLYPGTRLEELNDDYLRSAPTSSVIMRAGYNARDLDLVTYLAGIGDRRYMVKLASSSDGEARLTKQIIGNGLLLTMLNLMNQRGAGWSRATMLMSAARQGGVQTEESPLIDVGDWYKDELAKAARISNAYTAEMLRKDEQAQVVDV